MFDPYDFDYQPPEYDPFAEPFYEDPYFGYPNTYLPGDYSTGGDPQAADIATVGRRLTNIERLNRIRSDPFFNYLVSIETGEPTFPFEQLYQPGNPWLPDPTGLGGSGYAADYAALGGQGGGGSTGGGGFGGSGGGGNGYLGPRTLQASLNSTDPVIREAATQLNEGLDPGTVAASVYQTVQDPDLRKLYTDQVNLMWNEMGQTQAMGAGVGKPSPLAAEVAKWGITDPMQGYTGDTLPPEVEEELVRNLADDADKIARNRATAARVLERKAVYAPYEAEGPLAPPNAQPFRTTRREVISGEGEPKKTRVYTEPVSDRLPRTASRGLQPYGRRRAADDDFGGGEFGGGRNGGTGFLDRVLYTPEQNRVRNNRRAPVVTRNGRKYRTNSAGARANMQRRNSKQTAGQARSMEAQIREAAAQRLNASGRSPQTDWADAQIRYLRNMGVNI